MGRFDAWVFDEGAPSLHTIDAALRTARLIDDQGCARSVAAAAYVRDPSGGLFDLRDLRAGERLLIDTSLVYEREGMLYPSVELTGLLGVDTTEARRVLLSAALVVSQPRWLNNVGAMFTNVPSFIKNMAAEILSDPDAREAFLLAIASAQESGREETGSRGESFVEDELRKELLSFSRPDLAARVQRVSLYSDALGYDMVAPKLDGSSRRIEVKTTRRNVEITCTFFISRNEVEVGFRDGAWALAVCQEVGEAHEVVGWCRGATLRSYLPFDQPNGRWTQARVQLPRHLLFSGLPPAL